jgi:hypothetical protein
LRGSDRIIGRFPRIDILIIRPVSFLVPFAIQPIAAIQVVNNGVSSNTVMVHLDGTVVSEDAAPVGETLGYPQAVTTKLINKINSLTTELFFRVLYSLF